MYKKTILMFSLFFFLASCGGTFDSIKRGLTGEKAASTDEFLIKKKDPLILPPDYENLPVPGDRTASEIEKIPSFKETLEGTIEETSSSSSVEGSILEKIRSK